MKSLHLNLHLMLMLAAFLGREPLRGQSPEFTYQGQLATNGVPVEGAYDFEFRLFDDPVAGTQINSANNLDDVNVSSGVFTVTLDFGDADFNGSPRWLEIAVRPGTSTNGYTTLNPRQPITATPYAIQAASAGSAEFLSGTISAAQLTGTLSSNQIGAGTITGDKLANGAVRSSHLAAGAVTAAALANGAVGSNHLTAGAVTTTALADGAVTSGKVFSSLHLLSTLSLTNPTPLATDQFGLAVAVMAGDKLVVGAPIDDTGATDAGAAHLFAISGQWLTTFTNPTPASGDRFGFSVAAAGASAVVVGAFQDDAGAVNAGAVHLFASDGALLVTVTNPAPHAGDSFGYNVATMGTDRFVVGAPRHALGGAQFGAAFLYDLAGNLLQTITNPFPVNLDFFGSAVASVGADKILVGAQLDDLGAGNAGTAYLFSTNGTLLTTFTNPTPAASDEFGAAVASVGVDKVLIGARLDDTAATNAGAAYLFDLNGSLLRTYTNAKASADDEFGTAVAAAGVGQVLIGVPKDDSGGSSAGTAYLFDLVGNALLVLTNPVPGVNDQFGIAVAAFDENRLVVGTQNGDLGVLNAGAAYVFASDTFTPGLVADSVRFGTVDANALAAGAVTAGKIAPGAVSQLGSPDGSPLAAVQVNSDGYVGIGTNSPAAPLHVTGGPAYIVPRIRTQTPDSFWANHLGAVDVVANGNLLVTAARDQGLMQVVEFHPSGTTFFSSAILDGAGGFNNLGGLSGVALAGGLLAAAGTTDDAVTLISVTNFSNKVKLSELQDGVNGFNELNGPVGVAFSGNLLAIAANSDDAVTLVDVSNPGSPILRAVLKDGVSGFNDLNGAAHVAFSGNLLAIAANADDAVTLVDVSNPANPVLRAVLKDGVGGFDQLNGAARVAFSGHLLAIAAPTDSAVTLVDVSNPSNPVLRAVLKDGENGYDRLGGAFGLAFSGSQLAIGGRADDAVTLVDISDPANPVFHGVFRNLQEGITTMHSPEGITFIGSRLAVAASAGDAILVLESVSAQASLIVEERVGIGTTRPAADLHVVGSVLVEAVESQANSVIMRASGGFRLNSSAGTSASAAGVSLAPGASAWSTISDRAAKKQAAPVDNLAVLDKLMGVPVQQWLYQWEPADATPHLGPMAQDFKAAFYPGREDTSITTLEFDGVALAAIQGLNQKLAEELKQKDSEIAELKQSVNELRQLIQATQPKLKGEAR